MKYGKKIRVLHVRRVCVSVLQRRYNPQKQNRRRQDRSRAHVVFIYAYEARAAIDFQPSTPIHSILYTCTCTDLYILDIFIR